MLKKGVPHGGGRKHCYVPCFEICTEVIGWKEISGVLEHAIQRPGITGTYPDYIGLLWTSRVSIEGRNTGSWGAENL